MPVKSLERTVYQHIRSRILSGEFEAGTRISELAVARDLAISRAPVREAMRQLAGEELVELVPGVGAFPKMPTRRELASLIDLREAIEVHAVGRAARRIGPRQLAALDATNRLRYRVLRRIKDADLRDLDEAATAQTVESDARFHRTILKASGNPRLARLVDESSMLAKVWARRLDPDLFNVFAEHVQAYVFHRRITAALRRHDARAARHWMRRHLRTTRATYLHQARVLDQPCKRA